MSDKRTRPYPPTEPIILAENLPCVVLEGGVTEDTVAVRVHDIDDPSLNANIKLPIGVFPTGIELERHIGFLTFLRPADGTIEVVFELAPPDIASQEELDEELARATVWLVEHGLDTGD